MFPLDISVGLKWGRRSDRACEVKLSFVSQESDEGCARPILRTGRSGFTLIELLASVAVVAILVGLLFPAFTRIQATTRQSQCVSNLRQIGAVVAIYMAENEGYLPYWQPWTVSGGGSWVWDNYGYSTSAGGELPYLADYRPGGLMTAEQYDAPKSKNIFNCPANKSATSARGYAANQKVMGSVLDAASRKKMTAIPKPASTVLIADNSMDDTVSNTRRWFSSNGGASYDAIIGRRHGGKANVLFCDSHVELLNRNDLTVENIDPSLQN